MTITKAHLVEQVRQRHGNLSRQEALTAVNAIWDTIKGSLIQSQGIQIKGFGRFAVRLSAARVGRNMNTGHPHCGQPIPVSARRVVVFRPSNRLKQLINAS